MFDIKIDLGTDEMLKAIHDMEDRISTLRPVLQGEAQKLDAMIQRSFQRSESPLGERFPPLKNKRRRGKKANAKPLLDTGLYRRSINVEAQRYSLRFGVSGIRAVPARVHTLGLRSTRMGFNGPYNLDIPRRSVFPVDAQGRIALNKGRAAKWWKKAQSNIIRYVFEARARYV